VPAHQQTIKLFTYPLVILIALGPEKGHRNKNHDKTAGRILIYSHRHSGSVSANLINVRKKSLFSNG